ncbi:peptidoglycan DD-metalloendopeptidase family protein [Clostridium perfringens]|uniref:phage tail spike protein n=1 Tax=Clostridium perfringens TaxID=1502 RepID=UPI000D71CBFD|nr:phage tail spike protein [Clostridium perfringens]MBO3322895.1 peptidoglycan DD-metalloendopeptidase family protein [Clostridium perfringens]MBO3332059.1 peptidoglycan DD-metalloendopeptidase family protein [Clostridium perfringens]PWW97907.1 peptidase M23 [Clostridium perfringens]
MQYYKSSNTNFKKNGDITLQLNTGTLRVELNTGINEIEFEIPYDKQKRWKKVNEWGVVKCKVFYSKNRQLYRIYNVTKGMFGLKCSARHIFFDLIKHTILDNRAVATNGQRALDIILDGTNFKGHSDIEKIATAYFVKLNAIQAINGDKENSFRNRWGGEMLYDNFDIYVNTRIGKDNGIRIKYKRNMDDVSLTVDRDSIITKGCPVAYDGKMLPEKYICSQLINKYPIVCEGFIDVSDLKLKDPENQDDEGFDTEEELYNAMRERMVYLYNNGLDKPKVSGSVKLANLANTIDYKDFENLERVGIGDTVTIDHEEIGIDIKTRCIVIEWDLVTEEIINTEFGDVEVNYFDKQEIVNGKLENILNNNGTVNPSKMEGIIDALQTKFKALRDVAQPQHVLGMLFEDKIKGSKTYGAMAIGSMGFMIASERTEDDKDWNWRTFGSGQGFFADWLVGNLMTVLITNKDKSFEMDLRKPGGMTFRNNGIDAIRIENNMLKMYNWAKNGDYIGGLMALANNNDPDKPIVALGNDLDSCCMITYPKEGTTTHPAYVAFDKFNILKDKNGKPIRIYEDVDFRGNKVYNIDIRSDNGKNNLYVGDHYVNITTEHNEIVVSNDGIRMGKDKSLFFDARTGELRCNDLVLDGVIKNTSGTTVFDPNSPIGGGGVDTLGNVSKGIPSRKYFRYVKGIEGLQQYPGNIGDGQITYGYGVTKANEPTYFNKLGNPPCSEETASKVLFELMPDRYGSKVKNQMLKDGLDLSKVPQHVFDAFVDLCYNSGIYNSRMYRAWIRGASIDEIYNDWLTYVTMPGTIFHDGLKRRRKEEAEMFKNANYIMSPIGILNSSGGQIGTVKGDGYFPPIESSNFKTINNEYGNGWIIPVSNGHVTATFPYYPSGAPHSGIDFGVPIGTPVRASKSGKVIKRRELTTSYGKYLFIDHGGGLVTIYAHNSELLVNEGDTVKAGQVIARSGNTGNSSGPHCHWELRVNGTAQNIAPSLKVGDLV